MNTTITDATLDDESFALRVAQLAAEHAARSEEEGMMRSAAAIRSWGERVPPALKPDGRRRSRAAFQRWGEKLSKSLSPDADVEILVRRHGPYWLRSAAHFVRCLDPRGLGSAPFYAVDVSALGVESTELLGTTNQYLFDIVRASLPRTASPGPTVAINLREIVSDTIRRGVVSDTGDRVTSDHLDEDELRESIRAVVVAVGIHEAGHVLQRGDTPDEPCPIDPKIVIPRIADRLRAPTSATDTRAAHPESWVRAAAHLTARAARVPPATYWGEFLVSTLRSMYPQPDKLVDALSLETAGRTDEPIVEILKSPAPEGFRRLFSTKEDVA